MKTNYLVIGGTGKTGRKVVQEISEATGRPIRYQPVTPEAYSKGMKSAGLPAETIWLFEYLFKEVLCNPDNQVVSNDVEQVLGRKAIDFSEFAAETAETGIWDPSVTQIA